MILFSFHCEHNSQHLSSYGSYVGESTKKGLDLAIKTLNEDQKDVSFELIYEDSKTSPKDAIAAYKKLEMQNVHFFVVAGGPMAMAVAPLTKDKVANKSKGENIPE
jgi:hypothetical protein